MNPAENPSQRQADTLHFAGVLHLILGDLLTLIAARFVFLGALASPLGTRIARARRRLANLLAHLAAGRLPRPHTPHPGSKGGPRAHPISRSRGFLVHTLGYHAAGYASQLQHLLAAPQTQRLLADAPPGALAPLARTLRPLCRLLGVTLPPALQAPPRQKPESRKPARPRTRRPRPAPWLAKPAPPVIPLSRPPINFSVA